VVCGVLTIDDVDAFVHSLAGLHSWVVALWPCGGAVFLSSTQEAVMAPFFEFLNLKRVLQAF
jgi:hypothetical protein